MDQVQRPASSTSVVQVSPTDGSKSEEEDALPPPTKLVKREPKDTPSLPTMNPDNSSDEETSDSEMPLMRANLH